MDNEFYNNSELSSSNELSNSNEFNLTQEVTNSQESTSYAEFNSNTSSSTATSSSSSMLNSINLFGASAVMVGVLATVVVMLSVLTGNTSLYNVSINSLTTYGNSFAYDITVGLDYYVDPTTYVDFSTVDTGMRLVVVNTTTSITVPLLADENNSSSTPVAITSYEDGNYYIEYNFVGTVTGLAEGTRYVVEVISDNEGSTEVHYSEEIKTEGGAVTEIYDVTYQCNCMVDGTFEFTIDFIDENGFYSDFSYSVLTLSGEEMGLSQIAITDPTAKQIINGVDEIAGGYYILQIVYESTAYSDTNDETGASSVQKTIDITIAI